jgi:tRNA G18 (ribose-2'-O)-methylase SpoU
MKETVAVLVNIRSAWNVGSMFRTADAAGISKLYLVGYTPTPLDRFGRIRPDLAKVSLGAETSMPWEHVPSAGRLLSRLSSEGYVVCAVEQGRSAQPFTRFRSPKKTALVLGNEVRGLPPSILARADHILEIPMRGALVRDANHPRRTGVGKESLNVAVTFGIIAFHVVR